MDADKCPDSTDFRKLRLLTEGMTSVGQLKTMLNQHLEDQGGSVSRLIIRMTSVSIQVVGAINLLTKSPRPSKYTACRACREILG